MISTDFEQFVIIFSSKNATELVQRVFQCIMLHVRMNEHKIHDTVVSIFKIK